MSWKSVGNVDNLNCAFMGPIEGDFQNLIFKVIFFLVYVFENGRLEFYDVKNGYIF